SGAPRVGCRTCESGGPKPDCSSFRSFFSLPEQGGRSIRIRRSSHMRTIRLSYATVLLLAARIGSLMKTAAQQSLVGAPPVAEPTVLTDAQKARDRALAPKVEAILGAFGNFDPMLAPDGKHVLFRSDRGGLPEAYVADPNKPADPAKKVVGGPERVAS